MRISLSSEFLSAFVKLFLTVLINASCPEVSRSRVARMRTAVAKSGFQTTGSVLDAIIDRAGDVEEDAQNIIVQSKINADAYNDKATCGLSTHYIAY
jgi:hypothetical protein